MHIKCRSINTITDVAATHNNSSEKPTNMFSNPAQNQPTTKNEHARIKEINKFTSRVKSTIDDIGSTNNDDRSDDETQKHLSSSSNWMGSSPIMCIYTILLSSVCLMARNASSLNVYYIYVYTKC